MDNPVNWQYLIGNQLFELLTDKEKTELYNNCSSITYKKNDNIFRQNTSTKNVIFIQNGLVKVIKETGDDSQLIFKILKAPGYLGVSSAFGKRTYNYSAYALDEAKLCLIDKQWFLETMENNGKFARQLLEINCNEETNSINRLLTLLRKQVPGRMADVLLNFSKHIFQSHIFDLPLTRDEMADYIGVSKKSFIRTLSEFRNDKLINVEGKKVEIVREDLLHMLSKMG